MHNLRSDAETNTLFMTFSGEVTVANLDRLERTAVVAARVLESEFRLVTNISDCVDVTESAIERIKSVVGQLTQFGLTREVRIVGDSTPDTVRQTFDRLETAHGLTVDTVRTDDESTLAKSEETTR